MGVKIKYTLILPCERNYSKDSSMSYLRFQAIQETLNRQPVKTSDDVNRSSYFARNVFDHGMMQQVLTKDAFEAVNNAIHKGTKISRALADQIASSMRDWALQKGATHYTHWFQPLTGATAEKHDAFFGISKNGIAVEKFDGNQLVQQEPDASSFPHGGIRNTFEARGYTAWDPSSPAFIYEATLCIPTVFVSYTGEALDYKTPLLRALQAVDLAATDVVKYFDKNAKKVNAILGWEQEFFLIDSALVQARPDLVLAGRTLLGHASAKGQQLEDHYFGTIPTRVLHFLKDLEQECILLGIPIKTRHNEVAPNQFEIAPLFEEVNLAVDHNALIKDLMEKISQRHFFKVLLHEKPFEGINGSGKHCNWSLRTGKGINLLRPGKTPMSNLQFLTFFINTIKAVHEYEELVRASFASASNDLRLGENEAPLPIISIYIGSQLTAVLDELEKVTNGSLSPKEKTDLKLNVVGKIPEILVDNTDRNRTSPFAFTGNKFELRAVGASANCASSMTVINSIVAKQLKEFKKEVDALVAKKGMKKDDAIFNVLREYIKQSKRIRFEGDGYGVAWQKEAKKRKLSNHKTTPEALPTNISDKTIALLEGLKVMNGTEIRARYEIELESYSKRIQIEGRIIGDIARNHVIPTAIKYQNILIENVQGLKDIYEEEYKKPAGEQLKLIEQIATHIEKINENIDAMIEARKMANQIQGCG